MTALFFFKKFSLRSKHDPEKTCEFLAEVINGSYKSTQLTKLQLDDWLVTISLKEKDFEIRIRQKIHSPLQREVLCTVLKGRIRKKENEQGSFVKIIIRPSSGHILLLASVFLLLAIALGYAVSNNITGLLIISSILIASWYIGFSIHFNLLIKKYNQAIDACFVDRKYQFSHLS